MNIIKLSASLILVFLISIPSTDISKPEVMEFGKSMAEIKQTLGPLCDSILERLKGPYKQWLDSQH